MCDEIMIIRDRGEISELLQRMLDYAAAVGNHVLRADMDIYASHVCEVYPNTIYARMTSTAKQLSGRNVFSHCDGVIVHHIVESALVFSADYMLMLAKLQREALDKRAAFVCIPPDVSVEEGYSYVVRAVLDNQRPVSVTKIFNFAYGHKLYSPLLSDAQNADLFGPCFKVHGHNMELHITVQGWANPLTGMVINFTDLKRIVNDTLGWVDHGFLNDVIVNMPTTCENMAPIFWKQLVEKLPNLQKIKVYETPTSYCEIER